VSEQERIKEDERQSKLRAITAKIIELLKSENITYADFKVIMQILPREIQQHAKL
jgi:hypothetical protein